MKKSKAINISPSTQGYEDDLFVWIHNKAKQEKMKTGTYIKKWLQKEYEKEKEI